MTAEPRSPRLLPRFFFLFFFSVFLGLVFWGGGGAGSPSGAVSAWGERR